MAATVVGAVGLGQAPADAPPQPAPDRVTVEGEHFRVHADFDHEASARRALEVAERTWAAIAREMFEPAPLAEGERLDFYLYRTFGAYRWRDLTLTGGQFQRNLAFAHWSTKSAHVAVQPPLSDAALDAIGPGAQTLRLVAHECAHLVRYHTFANRRSHSRWIADGLASWVEPIVLREMGIVDATADHPSFARHMLRAQEWAQRGALPSAAEILSGAVAKRDDFFGVYSAHWLLFESLAATDGAGLRAVFDAARELRGGRTFAPRLRALVGEHIGADAELDAAWRAFVAGLQPGWREEGRSLEVGGEDWEQVAFVASTARSWRLESLPAKGWSAGGRLRILPAAGRAMEWAARAADADYCVRFEATTEEQVGRVSVVRLAEIDGQPGRVTLATAERALPRGRSFEFVVRCGSSTDGAVTLEVEVDGTIALRVPLDAVPEGEWGLSALPGSAGIWSGVTVG